MHCHCPRDTLLLFVAPREVVLPEYALHSVPRFVALVDLRLAAHLAACTQWPR